MTKTGSGKADSASERKEWFLDQLRDQDEVERVEKVRRGAWKVKTETGSKIVWLHYHVDFEFWGGSTNVNTQLSRRGDLIHVFLGPREKQYYVVPDDDLHSEQLTTYSTKDDSQWKFSAERGDPLNRQLLERSYTDLSPILSW